MKRSRTTTDRGFTLIEIMVAIVIVGIISTVVTFSMRGLLSNSSKKTCTVEVHKVNTAIQAYYSENKVWITTLTLSSLVPDYLTAAPSASSPSGAGTVDAAHTYKGSKC